MDTDLKRDTILEINPERNDFLTLQNTVGTDLTAVLIGDFELEKKDADSPVRKKGYMNRPQTDKNKKKQWI